MTRRTTLIAIALALTAGTAAAPPAEAARAAAKKPTTTVTTSTREPDAGKAFTLRGVASGARTGSRITTQYLDGGRWKTAGSGKVGKGGTYTATAKIPDGGTTRVRAVSEKATSPSIAVTTYEWHFLTDLRPDVHVGPRTYVGATMEVATTAFDESWVAILDGSDDAAGDSWDLSGTCKTLHSGFAWSDGTRDATALLVAQLDDRNGDPTTRRQAKIEPGNEFEEVVMNLRGAHDVAFLAVVGAEDSGWGEVGLVSPMIQCAW